MKIAQFGAKKKNRRGFFLFLIISCLTFFGCENPGSVGGGFTDINTNIVVDTIQVNDIQAEELAHYSGNLTYFSAGRFTDPFFGEMTATGLIKPSLSLSENDTMEAEAGMKLRLIIDRQNIYGDTLASAGFDLIELDQVWRGNAWKINDAVQLSDNPPVATFSVEEHDSIDITLSDAWVQSYREFFENEDDTRDSLYRIQFPGLAVVPKNSAKIVPFHARSSKFIIENPDEDTLDIGATEWAYSLQRSNPDSEPPGTFTMHNTLEQVISFDMGLTNEDLGTINISRVELVFYENQALLNSSLNQVPSTVQRSTVTSPLLYLVEPEFVPVILETGSPLLQGTHNETEGTYRFNLTSFVNSIILDGVRPELKFYMTLQENDGIIRSSLLHNDQAPEDKQPKLIVTSVQNESNSN